MVVTLRRVGDGWSFTLDDQTMKEFNWSADTALQAKPTPDGRGLVLSPATADGASAEDRTARIRRIGTGIADRHDRVLRKLAE